MQRNTEGKYKYLVIDVGSSKTSNSLIISIYRMQGSEGQTPSIYSTIIQDSQMNLSS